ncbi:helix-turn-helix transcriptional regulator [Microbacterium sp. X-17]|uniref:helix-turn-helix domain-containing protein n=1 Tax=Microbacterium sp. X-17 TaxID=3144404 RepID=UPI0031F5564A
MEDGQADPGDQESGRSEIAQFAAELRRLRLDAGNPTLVHLQHATGVSRSVISAAFAGRRLPSARTVDGIVRACGADPSGWLVRRDRLADEQTPAVSGEVPDHGRKKKRRTIRVTSAVWMTLAALLLGTVIGGSVPGAVAPHATNDALAFTVKNGYVVEFTPCRNDARVLASERRAANAVMQIMWSDKCHAAWATAALPRASVDVDTTIRVRLYVEGVPDGPDTQDDTENDWETAETPILVRPDGDPRLCAVGNVSQGTTMIDLGDPLCA